MLAFITSERIVLTVGLFVFSLLVSFVVVFVIWREFFTPKKHAAKKRYHFPTGQVS